MDRYLAWSPKRPTRVKGYRTMWKPQALLGLPRAYRLFGRLLGGDARNTYVQDYLQPEPGMRVLDIGCGPADILSYFPKVDYVGVDHSSAYVEAARKRYGSRGRFVCESVAETTMREPGSFDLVMANGVVHHLDDDEAARLFAVAAQALKPTGRLVTLDGCFVEGQSPVARWLLRRDRGCFVRSEAGYRQLADLYFAKVRGAIRHDLIRMPYTHLIMQCQDVRTHGGMTRKAVG